MSPLLAEVLAAADEMRVRTGGLVDSGIGERVASWGYDRTFGEESGYRLTDVLVVFDDDD